MTSPLLRAETEEVRLSLPYPNKWLSPNTRLHWSEKAKVVKVARRTAMWLTVEALGTTVKPCWPAATLTMVFCPPDNRRRDRDNIIASMKAATDGIADALGTDDSNFTITYSIGKPVKGGAVEVTIARAA